MHLNTVTIALIPCQIWGQSYEQDIHTIIPPTILLKLHPYKPLQRL